MRKRNRESNGRHLLQDFVIIAFSVFVAGVFVAGMFFTSIFTTAPAMAALGEISLLQGVFGTALIGAVGSVIGDLLIFRFVKDRFSEHIAELIGHESIWRRFHLLFKRRFFRWFTFLAGGLILSSPF